MKKAVFLIILSICVSGYASEKTTIRWSVIFKGTAPIPMKQGMKSTRMV